MKIQDVSGTPICGMTVRRSPDAHSYEYDGQTFFFCCRGCLNKFKASPSKSRVSTDGMHAKNRSGIGQYRSRCSVKKRKRRTLSSMLKFRFRSVDAEAWCDFRQRRPSIPKDSPVASPLTLAAKRKELQHYFGFGHAREGFQDEILACTAECQQNPDRV
jgi:YHS domain-containing protein